jgi:hypothetical protein
MMQNIVIVVVVVAAVCLFAIACYGLGFSYRV